MTVASRRADALPSSLSVTLCVTLGKLSTCSTHTSLPPSLSLSPSPSSERGTVCPCHPCTVRIAAVGTRALLSVVPMKSSSHLAVERQVVHTQPAPIARGPKDCRQKPAGHAELAGQLGLLGCWAQRAFCLHAREGCWDRIPPRKQNPRMVQIYMTYLL